ncbi:MAG TPA: MBL fold metallo-hydrolase, partial [Thauera sp.]|nr:MBL fold metallo-hydrolase [Thauera sp.]
APPPPPRSPQLPPAAPESRRSVVPLFPAAEQAALSGGRRD